MKKNGFTLVELLAVILIIGLIFLLAVTNVIPIFRKSKTKGFINDAVTLAEAARIKYKDDILNNIDDDLYGGNVAGKKCYSIEESLIGEYVSDLNTQLQGSVEVCNGISCEYDTKIWMTNGSEYLNGKIVDENTNVEALIESGLTPTNYSTCGIDLATSNYVYNFKSTGTVQSVTIPTTGIYRLEVWGAQGGSPYTNETVNEKGGYGGYSTGDIELTAGQTIYVVVGGKGVTGTAGTAQHPAGGYNGGGTSYMRATQGTTSGSGGGATHIALETGLLKNLSSKQDKIIIVAGGGGGGHGDTDRAGVNQHGGHGGGYEGGSIIPIPSSCNNNCSYVEKPTGGTQTTGGIGINNWATGEEITTKYVGTFGQGASGTNSHGGGGGGFYGGASGNYSAGAGGSGYIGYTTLTNKSMYCYKCKEALSLPDDGNIFTVSTIGYSKYVDKGSCPEGYSEKPRSRCAKAGDGFARITHIS